MTFPQSLTDDLHSFSDNSHVRNTQQRPLIQLSPPPHNVPRPEDRPGLREPSAASGRVWRILRASRPLLGDQSDAETAEARTREAASCTLGSRSDDRREGFRRSRLLRADPGSRDVQGRRWGAEACGERDVEEAA